MSLMIAVKMTEVFNKPINHINRTDIERLVAPDPVLEDLRIEYKEKLPGTSDSDILKFLASVSSFANTNGGLIIFGIPEKRDEEGKRGIPDRIEGVEVNNFSELRERLFNIVRDSVEPRISGVEMCELSGFRNGSIVIMRIPRSWVRPHMIKFRSYRRFYFRSAAGKQEMDLPAIRAAFLESDQLGERVKTFHMTRIVKILSGEISLITKDFPAILVHIIPAESMIVGRIVDLKLEEDSHRLLQGFWYSGTSGRFSFDGYMRYDKLGENVEDYALLMRNGAIEVYDSVGFAGGRENKTYRPFRTERRIIKRIPDYLRLQRTLGFYGPFYTFMGLVNVENFRIDEILPRDQIVNSSIRIEGNVLILPEAVIQSEFDDIPAVMKLTFDTQWQACGFSGSPNYPDGKWNYEKIFPDE